MNLLFVTTEKTWFKSWTVTSDDSIWDPFVTDAVVLYETLGFSCVREHLL